MRWVGALLLLLTGCVSRGDMPLATDAVRNETAAIAIARKVCNDSTDSNPRWEAILHGRKWNVAGYLRGERECPFLHVAITAENADASDCTICVVGR